MKKVFMIVLALFISFAFITSVYAEAKPKAAEKPAAAAEKAAPAKAEKAAPAPAKAAPEKAAPAPEKAAPAPAEAKKVEKPKKPKIPGFVGKVANVDLQYNLLTVKTAKTSVTFDISKPKFKGYKAAANIKVGDKVAVQYKKDYTMVTKIAGAPAPKKAKAAKAKAVKSFKDVDKNGDGKVTIEELNIIIVTITPEMFKKYDKNGDGALDESEYNAAMKAK